jgi:hypothetical protein
MTSNGSGGAASAVGPGATSWPRVAPTNAGSGSDSGTGADGGRLSGAACSTASASKGTGSNEAACGGTTNGASAMASASRTPVDSRSIGRAAR